MTLKYLQPSPASLKLSSISFLRKYLCKQTYVYKGYECNEMIKSYFGDLRWLEIRSVCPEKSLPFSAMLPPPAASFFLLKIILGIPRRGSVSSTNFWSADMSWDDKSETQKLSQPCSVRSNHKTFLFPTYLAYNSVAPSIFPYFFSPLIPELPPLPLVSHSQINSL